MEDYKQKYEEALKNINKIKIANKDNKKLVDFIEFKYPELKESEDEKIRKSILELVKQSSHILNPMNQKSMLAWLEKQGEQKPTDKVEQKFKVGDWIVNNNGEPRVFRVEKKDWPDCIISSSLGNQFINTFTLDKQYHLWTIQDAKDGDMLAYETDEEDLWIMIYWSLYEPYEGHVHYHALLVNDNFSDKGTCCICIDNLKPATKEQRDQLEKAMADAGYIWDSKSKRLLSLKAGLNYTQNPAWSEEDETGWTNTMIMIKEVASNHYTKDSIKLVIDWLKSLKQRIGWKPSEE